MSASRQHRPPAWVQKLLESVLHPRDAEACLGDLEEKFRANLRRHSRLRATVLYVTEGLGFIRLARKRQVSVQKNINMLSHALLFFSRLVKKDTGYYGVSMLGLAISLAAFMLITRFVQDELAYDQFHRNKDRIFRVTTHIRVSDVSYDEASSQFPAAAALQSEMGEVEEAVRVFPQTLQLESGELKFMERVIYADEHFFDVFTFDPLLGDLKTALSKSASVVLTSRAAKKYFGDRNPIGKHMTVNGQTISVTAVIADVPEQSHLKFDVVLPLSLQLEYWKAETGVEGRENKWFWTGAYTYVLLRTESAASAAAKLPAVVQKYFPPRFREHGRYELQPITDIHLASGLDNELEPGGSLLYVRLFSIVALVILVVSSINLVNLSYFKISSRVREIGVRKFLGQSTGRIIFQLATESVLAGLAAFVMAFLLALTTLGSFNRLVHKNLDLLSPAGLEIAGLTFLLIITISLAAVIRPAIQYAARSSRELLSAEGSAGEAGLRNVLIGMQVGFSFVLLVFSFIIQHQIEFFRNKDLGFDKANVVVVNLTQPIYHNLDAFIAEMKKSSYVDDAAGGNVPGNGYDGWRFVPEGGSTEKPVMLPYATVGDNFLSALHIRIVQGRDFLAGEPQDSLLSFIINKRAAVELGWAGDPLNKKLELFAPGTTRIMARGRVVGVMEDFHFESLHKPVKPLVLTAGPYYGTVLVRLNREAEPGAIASLGAVWKKFSDQPFEYEMLDRQLEKLYANEAQLSHVILFFTFIALYLTCYGLFAMSSLLFSSRLKEVAIRKVLGADQLAIVRRLYGRYAIFNLVAIAAGVPVAVYLGDLWLQSFQFRIGLEAGLFFRAAACVLLAGLLSVSFYLARVAWANPVKFLRSE